MKKRIPIVLATLLTLGIIVSAVALAPEYGVASSLTSSYQLIKADYPKFVIRLTDNGATEADIERFLQDLDQKVSNEGPINEANFNQVMLSCVEELLEMRAHRPILRALLNGFPEEIEWALQGRLHPGLSPLRNAVLQAMLGTGGSAPVTPPLSSETALKSLQISSGELTPPFSPEETVYAVVLPAGASVVPKVTAETQDSKASMMITEAPSLPGKTTVLVRAEDGQSTRTYTVNISAKTKASARLKSLTADAGKLSPVFAAENTDYTLVLPAGTTSVPSVFAVPEDAAAVSITQAISLPGSAFIKVVAADKQTTTIYRVDMDVADTARPPAQPISNSAEVDAETKRQLNQERTIIELKLAPQSSVLPVSGAALGEIAAAGKDLELILGKVFFRLSPGTIQIDKNQTLFFSAAPLPAEKRAALAQLLRPGQQLIGPIYDFYCSTEDSIFGVDFAKPVTVSISYAGENFGGADEDDLDVFYFSDLTKKWEPMHGTLNRVRKTVTFTTGGFSKYALIADSTKATKPVKPENTRWDPVEIVLTIDQPTAAVNGKPVALDAKPFIRPGANRTMAPLRFLSENLGATVTWEEESRQIIIEDKQIAKTIVLTLNAATAVVNGREIKLDAPAELLPSGRTFIPLRFVSENLAALVDYDAQTRTITIKR